MRRALLVATALGLLLAPTAQAAYDPVGSGTTKLILDKGFAAFLKQNEIALAPAAGAKRKGATYSLPVSGGQLDPTTAKGEIDTEGTLIFQAAHNKVPLRQIVIKTKRSPLLAKVGGGQLKIAAASQLSFKREGFQSSFSAKALALSAKVATRLNKKLRPKLPFSAAQKIGSLTSRTQPQLVAILEGGRSTLLFDSAFIAKLSSRFVSLNPIFPAEHVGPTFTFPIIRGGAIAPDASQGTLRSGGVVELLQLGGGQVFWQEFWLDLGARADSAEVDLEPTPAFPGKIGRTGVFDAAPGATSNDPRARTISDSGIVLTLQGATAKALNDAFAEGQALFGAGEVAGNLSFSAQGQ